MRFAIDRGLTADWTKRLGWLFDLRDQALHPRWALQGTVPHPSGLPVNVSPRQVDYLLQPDPTQASRRMIAGVSLNTSTTFTAGEAWAISKDRTFVVIRNDVDLQVDQSAYFTSDRSAMRATMRVGFAFPHPLAIVRLYDAP